MKTLTEQDNARIAEAVARAEKATCGEICCVLLPEVSDPRLPAVAWAAGLALIAPAIAVGFGFRPDSLAALWGGGWSVGHVGAAEAELVSTLAVYGLAQTVIFGLVLLVLLFTPLRRFLATKAQVHRAAIDQFEALGLANTRDRTGVLLMVSLAEHRAEVLADEGIYAKAPHGVWTEVVNLLLAGVKGGDPARGFVDAVDRTGAILAAHLPPRDDDANELPDGPVVRKRGR